MTCRLLSYVFDGLLDSWGVKLLGRWADGQKGSWAGFGTPANLLCLSGSSIDAGLQGQL